MPPTLTDHIATIQGTQPRGSAVGTLNKWTSPSGYTPIAAGIISTVLLIEIPDALAVGLEWDIDAGSADGIELIEVSRSDDGVAWDVLTSQVLNPALAPNTPGSTKLFGDVHGWKSCYLRVQVRSNAIGAGSNIQIYATDSIFASGRLSYVDRISPANDTDQNFQDRQKHVYAEELVYSNPITIAGSYSNELILGGLRTINLELGVKLTNWATITTLNIVPEVYFGGEWRTLQTFSATPGVYTITPNFLFVIPAITGNFNFNVGLSNDQKVTAEKVRFFVSGDVNDGDLGLYAIGKVPY